MPTPGIRIAEAVSRGAERFGNFARYGAELRRQLEEAEREGNNARLRTMLQLSAQPGYDFGEPAAPAEPRLGPLLMGGADRAELPGLGPAPAGYVPNMGRLLMGDMTEPTAPAPPAEPAPAAPRQSLLGTFKYGRNVPDLPVYYDPDQSAGAIKARAAAATAERNRQAFDKLKELDPDSYSDENFAADVDWTEELKRVLPSRGR